MEPPPKTTLPISALLREGSASALRDAMGAARQLRVPAAATPMNVDANLAKPQDGPVDAVDVGILDFVVRDKSVDSPHVHRMFSHDSPATGPEGALCGFGAPLATYPSFSTRGRPGAALCLMPGPAVPRPAKGLDRVAVKRTLRSSAVGGIATLRPNPKTVIERFVAHATLLTSKGGGSALRLPCSGCMCAVGGDGQEPASRA